MIYIFGAAFDPPHAGHTAIIRALLHYKNPEKIVLIPSGSRDDKSYHVSDVDRLAMIEIFLGELHDERVILDDYFIKNWKGDMITRDVDDYAQKKYGKDIVHVFGTDVISSMPTWDSEQYAAKIIKKIFVPRGDFETLDLDTGGVPMTQGGKKSISESSPQGGELEGCAVSNVSDFIENNYRVIRIPAFEILGNISGVYEFLKEYVERKLIGLAHPPNLPILGRDQTIENFSYNHLQNFEFFTDSHIPDISSTEVRKIIPQYTDLKAYFEEDPTFIIPGLSKKISRYILDNRLYRPKPEKKQKILVHVCCGPDATMPILQLRDEYDVICFWYDPNIQPKEEHDKRYDAFVKVCELENIPYIKGAYDVKNFFTRIKGVEHTPERGEKCTYCYDMRMYVTAKLAKRLRIPLFTSSLNTSPKKDLEKLFKMGHKYAEKFGVTFLDIPFRKRGGFEKSVEYTKEHDIFRQNYCGCIYSIREGGESDMKGRMVG